MIGVLSYRIVYRPQAGNWRPDQVWDSSLPALRFLGNASCSLGDPVFEQTGNT